MGRDQLSAGYPDLLLTRSSRVPTPPERGPQPAGAARALETSVHWVHTCHVLNHHGTAPQTAEKGQQAR